MCIQACPPGVRAGADEENAMTSSPVESVKLGRAHLPADDSAVLVDLTVGQVLAQRAVSHAGQPALGGVRHDGSSARLTYAELYVEALRVATALTATVDRGSYVALWAPNVLEWSVIQYG